MASPLEMYSKFGLANWICLAIWEKLVGKWPMADCYFKLCIDTSIDSTVHHLLSMMQASWKAAWLLFHS